MTCQHLLPISKEAEEELKNKPCPLCQDEVTKRREE